ncbi:amidase [Psychromarinibacter halotolerans]|nr:amidase [Psychromarinibacter halotolerans]
MPHWSDAALKAGLQRAMDLDSDAVSAAARRATQVAATVRDLAATAPSGAGTSWSPRSGTPRQPEQMDRAEDLPAWRMGIAGLATAFRSGELKPSVVLQDLLDRIDRYDPTLNAFVRLTRDRALVEARAADARFAAFQSGGTEPPALCGIPYGVKDIIDVEGLPTTCQSHLLVDNVASSDADIVRMLKQEGAVIVGKLATHEFANGLPSFDLPFPPARNPWNPEHHPGGSSSGAGTAVAAGFLPLAIGSDTGGSVRHPASACGVVGFKPGYERLPVKGVFPLSPTLDHVGLVTHTAEDADSAYAALTGSRRAAERPLAGLRVGYVRHFHTTDMDAIEDVATALDMAATHMSASGADVTEVFLPPLTTYFAVNRVILHAEAWPIHRNWLRETPSAYGRATLESLMVGAFLDPTAVTAARGLRDRLRNEMTALFDNVDLLLCASSMEPPARFDDPEETARTYVRQARTPFNITGFPALTLPFGLTGEGHPLSIQLAAREDAEDLLLGAAIALEKLRGPAPAPPMAW